MGTELCWFIPRGVILSFHAWRHDSLSFCLGAAPYWLSDHGKILGIMLRGMIATGFVGARMYCQTDRGIVILNGAGEYWLMYYGGIVLVNIWKRDSICGLDRLSFRLGTALSWLIDGGMIVLIDDLLGHDRLSLPIGAGWSTWIE